MTKHFFTAQLPDQALSVDCGWDRPLQHFYLNVIQRPEEDDEEDVPVYISIYDKRVYTRPAPWYGGLTLDELEQRFSELCITPPDGLIDALRDDQVNDRGNAHTRWPI